MDGTLCTSKVRRVVAVVIYEDKVTGLILDPCRPHIKVSLIRMPIPKIVPGAASFVKECAQLPMSSDALRICVCTSV